MDSRSPYSSSIAKRTRSQLEDFYRKLHNDVKKKRAGEIYTENHLTKRRERSHVSDKMGSTSGGSTWRGKRRLYEEVVDSEDSLVSDSSDDDYSDDNYEAGGEEVESDGSESDHYEAGGEEGESDGSEYSDEYSSGCGVSGGSGSGGGCGGQPIETEVVCQKENDEPILLSSGEEEGLSYFLSLSDSDSLKSPSVNNVVKVENQKLVDHSLSSSSYSDSLSFAAHNSNVSRFSVSRKYGRRLSKKNVRKEKSPQVGKLSRSPRGKRSNSSIDLGSSESSKKKKKKKNTRVTTNVNSDDVGPSESSKKRHNTHVATKIDPVDVRSSESSKKRQSTSVATNVDPVDVRSSESSKKRQSTRVATNVDSMDVGSSESSKKRQSTRVATNVDSMDVGSSESLKKRKNTRVPAKVDSVDVGSSESSKKKKKKTREAAKVDSVDVGSSESSKKRQHTRVTTNVDSDDVGPSESSKKRHNTRVATKVDSVDVRSSKSSKKRQNTRAATKVDSEDVGYSESSKKRQNTRAATKVDSVDVGSWESSKKRQNTRVTTKVDSVVEESHKQRPVNENEQIPISEITANVESMDVEPDEQRPFNEKTTNVDYVDDEPDEQRPFNVETTNVDVDSVDEEPDEQRPMSEKTKEPDDQRPINENIEASFDKGVDEDTHTIVNENTGPAGDLDSTKVSSDSTQKETDEDTPAPAYVDSAKASLFEKTSKARELDSTKMLSDLTQKEADEDEPIKGKKKSAQEAIKTLLDFLDKEGGGLDAQVNGNLTPLQQIFRFEDEDISPPPEKSEWDKEIDSLFSHLNMGLMENEADCNQPTMVRDDLEDTLVAPPDIDDTQAARCDRGEHDVILDEEIGLKCQYCGFVLLEIEHILPEFCTPPPSRINNKKNLGKSDGNIFDQMQFDNSDCRNPTLSSSTPPTDAVESLIPDGMYPHQREGFKFMWKHIAIDGNGCIISHAPGTGKTRLTIEFLQAYMNKCPESRPVIIAPRGMLLTWEDEFRKWGFNIPFYNLNKLELAEDNAIYARLNHQQVGSNWRSRDCVRLIKVFSWLKSSSILGVSYPLFEKLAGDRNRKGQHEKIKEWLLNSPGLLVLDEGHTPRSDQSLTWKALSNVKTNRRIMLSGTPFQNNFEELYNTLCLVNPMFADRIDKRGQKMIDKACKKRRTSTSDDILMKLRAIIEPFVHVHKGTILQQSLPGLRDSLVILRPTELQKSLLAIASKTKLFFQEVLLVSLISVHPCLVAEQEMFSCYKSEVDKIGTSIDAGVKTKFVTKLARLADALGERVLVFSQFIDPLVYIKQQLESLFSWKEGKEVIYMDGKLDVNQRQNSICSFNDELSKAKVLLASQKACSEGINLVGASRVVLLDVAWNPSVERQAISRAYRLGQKKVVHVYRLVTSGTVEVQKYESQAHKDRLSQLMFSPSDGPTSHEVASKIVAEDKVFEALVDDRSLSDIFEKIIHQPKSSELIDTFDFTDLKTSVGVGHTK